MINHARTLLMNRSGNTGTPPSSPGEEFVPPNFRQRTLPAALLLAHRMLFGASPDRLYLNYRLRQLLLLLHSTELDEHIRGMDPRVTYWPFNPQTFADVFQPAAVPYDGNGPGHVYFTGSHAANDGTGTSQQAWALEVVDSSSVNITRLILPLETGLQPYTSSGGLSSPISLPGTGLQVRFTGSVGDHWTLTSAARPSSDLGTLLAGLAASLGEGLLGSLLDGNDEPLLTYKNLWLNHELFAYKYGGLLMAIIYNLDQIVQVNDG